ncbi:MAG TPA: pilus assembly protein TadG-related protein [Candidatus Sulfotelmatobacter sp.]|nr:pilus assembly protein TadG-related protein [Candidatus Sulfotelmatobacter sp.]
MGISSERAHPLATDVATQRPARRSRRQQGQVLAIFAAATILFVGVLAIVIDVSWYWANSLRVQRAADAAALAGVVWLPGNVGNAQQAAYDEATKDGYTAGSGITVTAQQDSAAVAAGNPDQLDVTVSAPVKTFFMRLFGITSITAQRSSKAVYILPVPMGSPQAYYGIYPLSCVTGASGCAAGGSNTIPDAGGGAAPSSQGFFGAVISSGGQTGNGDMLDPTADSSFSNPRYTAEGYDYTVVVPSAGGAVYVFDPTFCGLGPTPSGATYGEGDHWIGSSGVAMNTYYRLYNTHNTQTTSDDTLVASSGFLFTAENQTDQSGTYGTPQTSSVTNCATGAIASQAVGGYWHNKWWPVGQGVPVGAALNQTPGTATGLAAGTYRLEVTTTDPASPSPASSNASVNAQNDFSIEVTGSGSPQVYGSGAMANWYNITGGTSTFYLAKVGAQYAGKTLEINLFDVGDTSGNTYLKIKSPDGGSQAYTGFTYTSASLEGTAGPSGSIAAGSSGLQATSCSGSCSHPFNDLLLTIDIPLSSSYGSGGLWQGGWWQVEYDVSSGNDTTTWQVNVLGNPVHLVVP